MKTIVHVVGARPNDLKIAPLLEALRAGPPCRQVLATTAAVRQHHGDSLRRHLPLASLDRVRGRMLQPGPYGWQA